MACPYATIIGMVKGGAWPSTVIDRIEVEGRYGVKLGQTWRDAERDLQRCIDDANESDPFLREHPATVELTGGKFSSSRVAGGPPAAGRARRRRRKTCCVRARRFHGEPYGADMRLLIHHGDTPTVIFGPGRQAPRPFGERVGLDDRGRRLRPRRSRRGWSGSSSPDGLA